MQLLFLLMMATGIDAGTNQTSCNGSVVTLQALVSDAPVRYDIQWEGNPEAGPFYVVTPTETTTYRAILTDLDSNATFEDTVTVFVHSQNPDLNDDGQQNNDDWMVFYDQWGSEQAAFDADENGYVNLLDWFYVCNFDVTPPNTPPSFSMEPAFTVSGETVVINYVMDDLESTPVISIVEQPTNGFALLLSGVLRYSPSGDFVGVDTFTIQVSDGTITTQPIEISVTVLAPDTWTDLYDDIFFPNCKACHIDAASAGLSLATYQGAQNGGISGPGFLAGFPESSTIYLRTAERTMPPAEFTPLTKEDIERIRLWITRGALE